MVPINICYFTDSLEPSGVGTHLALLLEGLDPSCYRPWLVCPPTAAAASLIARARAAGVTVVPLTVRTQADQTDYAALVALLRDTPMAVFHNQVGVGWEGHWGTHAARAAHVPVVISTEHLPYVLPRNEETTLKAEINRLVDRVITVSEEARQSHLASNTVRATQVVAIPNGIDPAPFLGLASRQGRALRRELSLAPDAPVVLAVARLYEQKGHRYLLDAWPLVRAQVPEAVLLLAGDGVLRWALEAQARELGVADSVFFLGTRGDVPALLAGATLAVLPSLFEGLPLFVLEAMAAARPVVGTRVCGASEAIADGETGVLVPARDAPALAAAITTVLGDPVRAAALGRAGRQRLLRLYHARLMVQRTCAVYETLLAHALPTPLHLHSAPALVATGA